MLSINLPEFEGSVRIGEIPVAVSPIGVNGVLSYPCLPCAADGQRDGGHGRLQRSLHSTRLHCGVADGVDRVG